MIKISPLTFRILAINFISIIILLSGVFYVGFYKKELTLSGQEDLKMDGETILSFVQSSFIYYNKGHKHYKFDIKNLQKIFKALGNTTHTHIRLDHQNGKKILDNWPFLSNLTQISLSPYQDLQVGLIQKTLDSKITGEIFCSHNMDTDLIFNISLPIFMEDATFLGVLTLTRENDFHDAILNTRKRIIFVSIVSFIFTTFLSLYLARTITTPIAQLANATKNIHTSTSKTLRIKALEKRKDEIGILYHSLSGMTQALFDRLDAIESFAADVSHEIKNPLCSMQSAIETIQSIKSVEKKNKLLNIIADDIKRLDRLITDISNASRVDAEMSRTIYTQIKIVDLLKTLTDFYNLTDSEHSDKPKIRFVSKVPKEKTLIFGIESRIAQVIQNLLGNALSFVKENTSILVTLSPRKIKGTSFLEIKVENEGPIIPKKNLKKIFERFYSDRPKILLKEAALSDRNHSGLGLSISKQIIESHRGTLEAIQLKDKKGNAIGTSFIIVLKQA